MKQVTRFFMLAGVALVAAACGPNLTDAAAMAETPEGAPCGPEALVEDAEDNNNQVIVQDGRSGYIYTYIDSEGTTITPKEGSNGGIFQMSPGGANGSKYAMRMNGTLAAAKIVFAGMGLNLTDPKDTYDASRYKGISFWAKRGDVGAYRKVRVKMPDINTDPDGGKCTNCYNDFGLDIKLDTEWQQYVVPFDRLKQESGWGSPRPSGMAAGETFAIQFQVKEAGAKYDVWVDEIKFTGCGGE
jgi:endoglucanase